MLGNAYHGANGLCLARETFDFALISPGLVVGREVIGFFVTPAPRAIERATSNMSFLSIIFLAFAMATDAFAAAIGKGAALHKPDYREAIKAGLIFGTIEAATPVIGWGLGRAAQEYVTEWDHWIAFTLLLVLGLRMIWAGFQTGAVEEEKPDSHSFWALAITGFATSIDAMAVGAGLAFVDVNIVVAAIAIGLATTLMVTIGVLVGRLVGPALGRWAEAAGGVVLIVIGSVILYEHLYVI
ncbi:manganese efflux pump MntP [Cupriavidus pampae]|uniref:Putative manganese efflux pump MntP n=2 Tax=Cupriavidus pampae TaxID=659251 RepID=A0ABM8WU56_9BURK|nr:manganese efflux pump MntP [Cupriavidus pampae]